MISRLYVTDLDGTLLNKSGKLSEYSAEVLNFLICAGVQITFATARSFRGLQVILEAVQYQLPVITFNGGHISDLVSKKHLLTSCIDASIAEELYQLIEEKYDVLISCFENDEDILKYNTCVSEGIKQYVSDREKQMNQKLQKFDGFADTSIMGYTIIDEKEKILKLKKELIKHFDETIKVEVWEDMYYKPWYWLSIHSSYATKGQALKKLKLLVDTSFDEVIVFGDQNNDIDMFSTSDQGFAVENAIESLKEISNGIIGPHDEDSVVKKILEVEGMTYVTV